MQRPTKVRINDEIATPILLALAAHGGRVGTALYIKARQTSPDGSVAVSALKAGKAAYWHVPIELDGNNRPVSLSRHDGSIVSLSPQESDALEAAVTASLSGAEIEFSQAVQPADNASDISL